MKKYTFLVYHKEYRKFLTQLGNIGVLHVIERDELKEDELLTEQNSQIDLYRNALKSINTAEEKYPSSKQTDKQINENPEQLLARVDDLNKKLSEVEEEIGRLTLKIERLIPWGEYDSDNFNKLSSSGYKIYFYVCPVNQFKEEWEKDYYTFRINEQNGNIYFLVVSITGVAPEIGHDPIILPSKPLSFYEKVLEGKIQEKLELNAELKGLSRKKVIIQDKIQSLETESSMISVMLDSIKSSEDKLMALEGWVPKEMEGQLIAFLDKQDILYYVSKREENEFPPVLLKNSKFSKLFEPISKLFDLPGYAEMDLTPYFAPFFMIFFGFCLGDAGYGVFFIIIAAILKLKVKKEFKPVLTLLQYFGIATIIFGMVSGTFFGMNLIDSGYTITAETITELEAQDVPESVVSSLGDIEGEYFQSRNAFLKAISLEMDESSFQTYKQDIVKHSEPGIPLFSKFRHLMRDSLFMFYFALFLGGVQILFGIFIRIFNITKRDGFKYAYSTLGWFILVLTVIVFNAADKFGWFSLDAMKIPYYILLGIAAVMILFLNTPGASIFARLGSGIWDSYSTVTGLFGDILSYIRLFALGLSSGILGFVFNDIALQFLDIPYIGWLFFLIMLIFGHTLNIFLATLGGFVHPMRLTFVEFYKNAGFKGGGKEYKPFKINT